MNVADASRIAHLQADARGKRRALEMMGMAQVPIVPEQNGLNNLEYIQVLEQYIADRNAELQQILPAAPAPLADGVQGGRRRTRHRKSTRKTSRKVRRRATRKSLRR